MKPRFSKELQNMLCYKWECQPEMNKKTTLQCTNAVRTCWVRLASKLASKKKIKDIPNMYIQDVSNIYKINTKYQAAAGPAQARPNGNQRLLAILFKFKFREQKSPRLCPITRCYILGLRGKLVGNWFKLLLCFIVNSHPSMPTGYLFLHRIQEWRCWFQSYQCPQ